MDNFFNHDVASWITGSMSRMDPAEAEMFGRFFVYEVHKADLDNNRRTIDSHAAEVSKRLISVLKPEDRALIAKADFDTNWGDVHQQEQPRDKTGKWRKIKVSGPTFELNTGKNKVDVTSALNRTGKEGTAFSQAWTERGPNDHTTNERTYRRVEAGAKLLGAIPGKHAQTASAVGQFAGQFGPEAEKVVGPAARRTAYRYRGTERMADERLLGFAEQKQRLEQKRLSSDEDYNRVGGPKPLSPEQKMKASEDAAAAYLYSRLPKKNLAGLHRASGKLPPSEGVIINADGDIVTQAVGYNEDHYLPFNLKNLKGLQGGSYVRTRSTGGLTSEDIYTGLVAGARSVTVVSRSGVFTIDFQDDLRGGRRYSDKARQMVGRYAQTLDAVQSKQVSRRGLTPDEKAEIREEIESDADLYGWKAHEVEAKIKERETEYAKAPHVTSSELDSVKRKALEATESYKGAKSQGTERMPDDPAKRYRVYYGQFMDEVMEEKAKRMYSLDADGYEAAQSALREQFPYFIADTSTVKRLPGEDKSEDLGYVRPNYNRPKAVQAGYFDPDINGQGKFSAAELHYQNYSHKRGEQSAASGETASTDAKKGEPKKVNLAEAKAMGNAAKVHRQMIKEATEVAASVVMGNKQNETDWPHIAAFARENKDVTMLNERQLQDLVEDLNKLKTKVSSSDAVDAGTRETFRKKMLMLDKADRDLKSGELVDRRSLDPGVVSKYPQKLGEERFHVHGARPEDYVKAYDDLVHKNRIDNLPSNPTDEQLFTKQTAYSELYRAATAWSDNPSDVAAQTKFLQVMDDLGFAEEKIKSAQERGTKGDMVGIKALAQESGNKANAVAQMRSVLRAAGGSLTLGQGADLADGTLKGEVVESNTARKNMGDEIREMLDDYPHAGIKRGLNKLAEAFDSLDTDAIEEELRNLPEDIRDAVQEKIRPKK